MSNSSEQELEAYERANNSLLALIRGERYATRTTEARRQRAEEKLGRIRTMLSALGNPQHRYPTVHITGTSGKGSTAANVAGILSAAGYRTGLRTSPYLQVATEKLQIGASLIDAFSFAEMVSEILAEASRLFPSDRTDAHVSYAEVWSALSFGWLAERQVDIAVVEVGAGGRFDASNVIDPVVSVITSVGLDHIVTLGPTIEDIAWHKAGIIKAGGTTVLGDIPDEVVGVIADEAKAQGAQLIRTGESLDYVRATRSNLAAFQRRNAEVATTVAQVLRHNGFEIPDSAICEGIGSARLPGRLEQMPGESDPAVWIDGAHNSDKVSALAREVTDMWSGRSLPVVVLGVLESKNPMSILSRIGPVASKLVLTAPSVVGKRSLEARRLADCALVTGFAGEIYVEENSGEAVRCAQSLAKSVDTDVLVTGSMYLCGQVRGRWYRDEEIVVQRTSWPGT